MDDIEELQRNLAVIFFSLQIEILLLCSLIALRQEPLKIEQRLEDN